MGVSFLKFTFHTYETAMRFIRAKHLCETPFCERFSRVCETPQLRVCETRYFGGCETLKFKGVRNTSWGECVLS